MMGSSDGKADLSQGLAESQNLWGKKPATKGETQEILLK